MQKLVRRAAAHQARAWTCAFGQPLGHAAPQTAEDAVLLNGHDEFATGRQFGEQVEIERLHGVDTGHMGGDARFRQQVRRRQGLGQNGAGGQQRNFIAITQFDGLAQRERRRSGMHQRFTLLANADVNGVLVL